MSSSPAGELKSPQLLARSLHIESHLRESSIAKASGSPRSIRKAVPGIDMVATRH